MKYQTLKTKVENLEENINENLEQQTSKSNELASTVSENSNKVDKMYELVKDIKQEKDIGGLFTVSGLIIASGIFGLFMFAKFKKNKSVKTLSAM